ncbi:MAG: ATP-binding SpoIIE family protein phosphatase, partial [Arenimonas sp.]
RGASRVNEAHASDGLSRDALRRILDITRDLARPLDLATLLHAVVDAAKHLLDAEGGTVWQYLPGEHVLEMRAARGLDAIRIPSDRGIAGECVRTLTPINVPDCYADPRFNRDVDVATGQHTRCMLTLPLLGDDNHLVGVLQVVNRREGAFDVDDEAVALALAAQCAVALQRAELTERLVATEALRQEIAVAREVQMATLPAAPPRIAGYDLAGLFLPTDDTGGDTYDFVPRADGTLFLLMGDATGHGIGPALSATQVRAMLRVAERLGASLDDAFRHINDQLVDDLPGDRFVTAFLGRLDPSTHAIEYHSGGQGPLLHYHADDGVCELFPPTTFPMGAISLPVMKKPERLVLAPGDVFALVSDGIYEYQDGAGQLFGEEGVAGVLRAHRGEPMARVLEALLAAVRAFGAGAPQLDDITAVLVCRLPDAASLPRVHRAVFARSIDSLAALFAFLDGAMAAEGIAADVNDAAGQPLRNVVGFVAEELFTNMVKYNADGGGEITVEFARRGNVLECVITDPDSERFDVTAAPDVDVTASAGQREPGGLGIHLSRRLADDLEYDYSGRTSRITFRKALGSD